MSAEALLDVDIAIATLRLQIVDGQATQITQLQLDELLARREQLIKASAGTQELEASGAEQNAARSERP